MNEKQITITKNNKGISTKTLISCYYCGYYFKKKNLTKCSKPKCENKICHNCSITINDKPFCPECMIRLMKEDTVFILTKGNI